MPIEIHYVHFVVEKRCFCVTKFTNAAAVIYDFIILMLSHVLLRHFHLVTLTPPTAAPPYFNFSSRLVFRIDIKETNTYKGLKIGNMHYEKSEHKEST
jgi:hypothetical protein